MFKQLLGIQPASVPCSDPSNWQYYFTCKYEQNSYCDQHGGQSKMTKIKRWYDPNDNTTCRDEEYGCGC